MNNEHFARAFEKAIIDIPPHGPDHEFAAEGAGSRATTIWVKPHGQPGWIGSFAAPDPGVPALTGCLGTPSPDRLCVLERGSAFLGDVADPDTFAAIKTAGPVVQAGEMLEDQLLVLITPWSITAVDHVGLRWTSGRLAVDGIAFDETSRGCVRGVADPVSDAPRDFALDLDSGRAVGEV